MANASHVPLFIIVLPCSSASQCTLCKTGNNLWLYSFIFFGTFLKTGKCYGCSEIINGGNKHCEVCSYTVSTFACTTCKEKFFKKNGSCYTCDDISNGGKPKCDVCSYVEENFKYIDCKNNTFLEESTNLCVRAANLRIFHTKISSTYN